MSHLYLVSQSNRITQIVTTPLRIRRLILRDFSYTINLPFGKLF